MKEITINEMEIMIKRYNNGETIPRERFWCKDGDRYVEMDNTDDESYVSDWQTKEECFLRCLGYIDSDGQPFDLQEIYKDFMKLVNHIIQFEEDEAENVFEFMELPRELADF